METLQFLADNLGVIASIIGSVVAIGTALIWVAKKIYLEPKDRRREAQDRERQRRMEQVAEERNKPLRETLDKLNSAINDMTLMFQEFQGDSSRDRENLNKIADQNIITLGDHERQLKDHEQRIFVLEASGGKVTYREHYGKGDDI